MERKADARRDSASRLFDNLVASRPGQPERGRAWAIAAAIGIHGCVLGLAGWAIVAGRPAVRERKWAEREYTIDLLPPSLLSHVRDHTDGRAAVSNEGKGEARTPTRARVAARLVREDRVEPRRFARLRLRSRRAERVLGRVVKLPARGQLVAEHSPTADELAAAPPRLVPYTQPPQLANEAEVQQRLVEEYPDYLQDEGIGGRVVLWFLVDENGKVRKYFLKDSSGRAGLDRAALNVAARMRFRPAVNYDRHVAVWVALPVMFQTAESAG